MNEQALRDKLPIGSHEKIIKVIRHHWFAYVSVYIGSALRILLILSVVPIIGVYHNDLQLSASAAGVIAAGGGMFAVIVGLFSLIPAWLKKQEYLVLTEEALMQVNKPSIFTNKVSQLNLVHVSDVTVNQDAIGSLLGYGKLVIETPGEQDNYIFSMVNDPRGVSKAIVEAHENYAAALESGQIQTTLGSRPPVNGTAWRPEPPLSTDARQYQPVQPPHDSKAAASALGHIASEEAETEDQ